MSTHAIHIALASECVMRLLAAGMGGISSAAGGDSMLLRLSETMAMLQDWSPGGEGSATPA